MLKCIHFNAFTLLTYTLLKNQAWRRSTSCGRWKIQSSMYRSSGPIYLCGWRIFPIYLRGWRNFPSPACCAPSSRLAFVTVITRKRVTIIFPLVLPWIWIKPDPGSAIMYCLPHHRLCGRIRPSKSYFFQMHKTSKNNYHIYGISSQIDSKYSGLSKYVFEGLRSCNFSCVQTTFSAEGSLVSCRMEDKKCMKKRCVKFMWQNIYFARFFGFFCIIMDNPCVKNAKQIF
jgi:hypothetical protein